MRLGEASSVLISLRLSGVDPGLNNPTNSANATTNVTRRLTGTAYDPIREIAGADEIVRNALRNRCIVIGHSVIRVCTIVSPRGR
jgi:hypothetical protein